MKYLIKNNTFISQNCSNDICMFMGAYHFPGPDSTDEDEHYERAISESNCIYRLQGDRFSPLEQAWAAVPHRALLNSSQVLISSYILLKNK